MQVFAADVYEMGPLPPLFEAPLEMCVWTAGGGGADVATY
jgi:hypothetical protein